MVESERENWIRVIEAQPKIDERFARIRRIDSTAGTGNFSLVFKALDESSGEEVALKFYSPLRRGETYRERSFERESLILERLKGQRDILQIVQPKKEFVLLLTDRGTGLTVRNNLSFLVTELAHSNMGYCIYSERMEALRKLQYFRTMCRAVQRIHSQTICHRDIKPENFFRVGRNEIHLGDFGTARALDGTMPPLLDDYRGWRGDKRYTAPEQCIAMNERPELFYVGDMYSLGAILFEMFTEQPLFPFVFDNSFHESLTQHFSFIPRERREVMFRQLTSDIVRARRLPNIYDFDTPIPNSIMVRLNRLYQRLASLDYERRDKDFSIVFHEVNMCEGILQKEAVYKRLIELRRQWAAKKKEHKMSKK